MKKTFKRALFPLLFAALLCCVMFVGARAADSDAPVCKAVCGDGSLTVSWSRVPGAVRYELFKKNQSGDWVQKQLSADTARSFRDVRVKNGKEYAYRVRAVSATGNDSYGVLRATYLAPPTFSRIQNEAAGIGLHWKARGDSVYRVYRQTASGKWKLLTETAPGANHFVDTKVQSGKQYGYTLRVRQNGALSAYVETPATQTFLAKVTGVAVKNSPGGVALSWNKTTGAKNYQVFRKVPGGSWQQIATVSAVRYVDPQAPFGKKCSYAVCSRKNSNTTGARSGSVSLYCVDPGKPMIALTYDDGPYRPGTNLVLDALEKHHGRATFFVVGNRLATYQDCLKRASSLGCEIGCHTYSHTTLTSAADETIRSEINKTNSLITGYTGQNVRLVRAPGGAVNDHVKAVVPYPFIQWSVDTRDWEHRNTQRTIDSVKANARDGSIVLMHDIHMSTANAAEAIVSYLTNAGYQLVTVSEMMDAKGVSLQRGSVYNRG